jgi:ribose/xylose/arabinose/galactoside ABC-type transport system permease subunit
MEQEKFARLKINESRLDYFYKYGILVIFIGLFILMSLLSPQFLTKENIISLLITTVPMGIAVVGMTFVIMTAGIDMSIGAVIFACGTVSVLAGNAGFGFWGSLGLTLLTGAGIGALNGVLVAKGRLIPILVTLATMNFFRGMVLVFTNEKTPIHENTVFREFVYSQKLFGIPVVVVLFFAIAIIAQFVLTKTKYGWHLRTVGFNVEAAKKIGINVTAIVFSVYLIIGILVSLNGFIYLGMIGQIAANFGIGQEFLVISATVLGGVSLSGGKGNVLPGAIVGIFIITIIENGMGLISANPYAYAIVRGAVVFAAVFLDSMRYRGPLR